VKQQSKSREGDHENPFGRKLNHQGLCAHRLAHPTDIRTYHIDVEELAELAEDAGVGTLVLTHQVPTVDDEAQIGLVFRTPISAIYGGELVVAVDGTSVTLPVNGGLL